MPDNAGFTERRCRQLRVRIGKKADLGLTKYPSNHRLRCRMRHSVLPEASHMWGYHINELRSDIRLEQDRFQALAAGI